jgi:hypothetical protein
MAERVTFDQFLQAKGIDPAQFAAAEPQRYQHFLTTYQGAGPVATDYAKKFQWNEIRLAYPLNASLQKE